MPSQTGDEPIVEGHLETEATPKAITKPDLRATKESPTATDRNSQLASNREPPAWSPP